MNDLNEYAEVQKTVISLKDFKLSEIAKKRILIILLISVIAAFLASVATRIMEIETFLAATGLFMVAVLVETQKKTRR